MPDLSHIEQSQLGSVRLCQNGKPSTHPWPDATTWPEIRSYLVQRSLASNPALNAELTAYTPGETLDLLQHPDIVEWQRRYTKRLAGKFTRVVFVPCAKTKPWTGPGVARSRLYSAYNTLREEMAQTCFVTISEPLGVVPQQRWGDFLQYDNPGLFTDDSQRSSMTTAEWNTSPFGRCYGVPFDQSARVKALTHLGGVVGKFLKANAHLEFVSFVDSITGPKSTHGLMLDTAVTTSGIPVTRFPKRPAPRTSPLDWMREILL
jgi:hypothetical protein